MSLIKHDSCDTSSACHQISCWPFVNQDTQEENQTSSPHYHSPSDNHVALVDVFGLYHMKLPFPYKLHILLCDMEITGHEHIISWVEDGKAFKIHDQKQFETLIQPRYFRQSKIASFTRQCYMYGFSKIEGGPFHRGSYLHPDFQRNNQEQSLTIQRRLKSLVDSSLQRTNKDQRRRRRQHAPDPSTSICKGDISRCTRLSRSSSAFIQGGSMKQVESIIIEQGQDDPQPRHEQESTPFLCQFAAARPSPHLTLNNKKNNFDGLVAENDHFFSSAFGHDLSQRSSDDPFVDENYDITTAFLEPSPIELMLSKALQGNNKPGRRHI